MFPRYIHLIKSIDHKLRKRSLERFPKEHTDGNPRLTESSEDTGPQDGVTESPVRGPTLSESRETEYVIYSVETRRLEKYLRDRGGNDSPTVDSEDLQEGLAYGSSDQTTKI